MPMLHFQRKEHFFISNFKKKLYLCNIARARYNLPIDCSTKHYNK